MTMPSSTVRMIVESWSLDARSASCASVRTVAEARWFAIVRAEQHLGVAPGVRLVVVEHELAEQPAAVHERHEGERADPSSRTARSSSAGKPAPARSGTSTGSGSTVSGGHGECPSVAARYASERPRQARKRITPLVVAEQHRAAVGAGRPEQDVDASVEQLVELVARLIASAMR